MKQPIEVTRMWVADEVLEYLVQHPNAQDTLEGVCDWWLLERRVRRTVVEVEAALSELVAMGFLVASRGKDGKTHYRIVPKEEPTIRTNPCEEQGVMGRSKAREPTRPSGTCFGGNAMMSEAQP